MMAEKEEEVYPISPPAKKRYKANSSRPQQQCSSDLLLATTLSAQGRQLEHTIRASSRIMQQDPEETSGRLSAGQYLDTTAMQANRHLAEEEEEEDHKMPGTRGITSAEEVDTYDPLSAIDAQIKCAKEQLNSYVKQRQENDKAFSSKLPVIQEIASRLAGGIVPPLFHALGMPLEWLGGKTP